MSGDMHQTIIPKSDQLNADDLIGREMTIKITAVDIKGGQEQPVSIHFDGDNGKPYKACKSMCRVMVSAWGADSKKYVGRSMTLYRDPKVKWGGMEVGGIRISHMSDISDDMTMALTVTRANKKPFTVRPITEKREEPREHDFALGNCTTLEELAAVWKSIPKAEQPKYAAKKDELKATLTPPETGTI
jgi:hypothetical protein